MEFDDSIAIVCMCLDGLESIKCAPVLAKRNFQIIVKGYKLSIYRGKFYRVPRLIFEQFSKDFTPIAYASNRPK